VVALVLARDAALGDACRAELEAAGHAASRVGDPDEAIAAVGDLGGDDRLGALVVVAAGWGEDPSLGLLDGVQRLLRAALPAMAGAESGRVVVVVEATGLDGHSWSDGTGATMWGLVGLARAAARELAPSGVTVNVVRVGPMPAPGGAPDPAVVAETPLRRAATPDDVAAAVGYLVSPDAGYTTGIVLPVDGGLTMGQGA
jgi:NAD(P)-dependent dehydrogenase (short-subunit alcohol dehydrogenase family)